MSLNGNFKAFLSLPKNCDPTNCVMRAQGIAFHTESNSCAECDSRVATLLMKHKDLCHSEQFRALVNGNKISDIVGDTYLAFWFGNIDGIAYKLLKEERGC